METRLINATSVLRSGDMSLVLFWAELWLEAYTVLNARILERGKWPRIYRSHVRYVADEGPEVWRDVGVVVARGAADCKSLAPWRAAELRREGFRATCQAKIVEHTPTLLKLHAFVNGPDGLEDPSWWLGG